MSPALIGLLYEQTERDMAERALLHMEGTLAATGVSWLTKGSELFAETRERFLAMAGLTKRKASPTPKEARKKLAEQLALMGARSRN